MAPIANAMSVDVEEYYHAEIFKEATNGTPRGQFPSRVEESVRRVLALFSRAGIRATFFVLGEVARRNGAVVKEIAAEGHEIACHGERHEPVFRQNQAEFRADVRGAKARLEDLTGRKVDGYRAPSFSIGRREEWAYDVLLEEGFRYDSSQYPILHDRYGRPGSPRFPFKIVRCGRPLIEFPVGTMRLLGVNFPIGGGGFFRLVPWRITLAGIRRVNAREGQPIMFYLHPWEMDCAQPRPPMRWHQRFRLYVGIPREEVKIAELLKRVDFAPAHEVLGLESPRGSGG